MAASILVNAALFLTSRLAPGLCRFRHNVPAYRRSQPRGWRLPVMSVWPVRAVTARPSQARSRGRGSVRFRLLDHARHRVEEGLAWPGRAGRWRTHLGTHGRAGHEEHNEGCRAHRKMR